MQQIEDTILRPIFRHGFWAGVTVWNVGINPHDKYITCGALQFEGWNGGYQLQFGTSEHVQNVIHHDASNWGQGGTLAYDETLDHFFLKQEEVGSRDTNYQAVYELDYGELIESIDILVARHEVRNQNGTELKETFAGLRFNQTSKIHSGAETSFGFVQLQADETLRLGLASAVFADLPSNIRFERTLLP